MATIVVDELITKLEYEFDGSTVEQAEQAAKQLEQQNKATAAATNDLSAQQLKLAQQLQETKERAESLRAEEAQLRAEMKQAGGGTQEQRARLAQLGNELRETDKRSRDLRNESSRLSLAKRELGQRSRQLSNDQRRLQKATRDATRASRNQADELSRLRTAVAGVSMGNLVTQLGSRFVSAAQDAVRWLAELVPGFVELADNVGKTSRSLGVSSTDLQRLRFAGQRAGLSIEQVDKSLGILTKQLEDARAKGTGPAADAFKTLGLSIADFQNLGTEERVKRIADAINALPNPTQRSAVAMQLFGARNKEMTVLLAEGADGIQKLGDRAQELGGVIDEGAVLAAERMADQFLDVRTAAEGLKNRLATSLAPTIEMISVRILDWFDANKDLINQGLDAVAKVLFDVFSKLGDSLSGLPIETIIAAFVNLVEILGELVNILFEAAEEGGGILGFMLEFAGTLLDAASSLLELRGNLAETKESLGDLAGPLDLVLKAVKLLLKPIEFLADLLNRLVEASGPFLDRVSQFAESLPSLSDIFSGLGSAAVGFAENLGLVDKGLAQTASMADIAAAAFDRLSESADFTTKTDAELQALVEQGNALAIAEVERRVGERTQGERQVEAAKRRQQKVQETSSRADKLLSNPDTLSRDALTAMIRDPGLTEKQRDKAQKEIDKRDKQSRSAGKKAADSERQSLLTADIEKQIDELAKAAGRRAAARAQLSAAERNQPLSAEERNRIERSERKAVSERLTTRFTETGQLPPGLATDLVQAAALPNIEEVGGRLAPPVITVNNMRIEVTGNTFEARVTVEGGMSASPQSVAQAVVTRAQPVTFQEMATAIQNQLTNER